MMVHRHGFLCGTPGISATIAAQQGFRAGMWGGEGFTLQKLEGQGRAWIELSGEVTKYTLDPGQTLLVHPGQQTPAPAEPAASGGLGQGDVGGHPGQLAVSRDDCFARIQRDLQNRERCAFNIRLHGHELTWTSCRGSGFRA